jgi:hypothetical protein
MSSVTEQSPEHLPLAAQREEAEYVSEQPLPEDGTRQLLQSGAGTLAAGILAAALTKFVFGGIGPQGPHTNSGWLSLMVAMMCLPFGFLLFLLGAAKWLRNKKAGIRELGHRD